ncbi:MAG TPA: tail fiber domain-containing protein [Pyrinomonadaceae bacterium]|nr:tail fiber domain-containing protein [Pyrinomonadaceae bacterium]
MTNLRNLISTILLSIFLTGYASAQHEPNAQAATPPAQAATASAPAVTVSVAGEGVRFTSPGQVLQIQLEVYSDSGDPVFDSGLRQGNILDWRTTDARPAMTDGSYLAIVTVKGLSGRLSQRFGSISSQAGQLSVGRVREEELSPAQKQALSASRKAHKIEAAGSDTAFTILKDGTTRAATVTTHDGQNGQVTSTSGDLTFRTGDVLAGRDREQMRVTADGRVGIGTDRPEAALDVAGEIRARGGIRFDDGTLLRSAIVTSPGTGTGTGGGGTHPTLGGNGTTNRMTKWTDGPAGTLGDSIITESAGKVGIGATNPSYSLVVGPDIAPGFVAAAMTVSKGANQSASVYVGPSSTQGIEFGWDINNNRGFVNAPGSPFAFTHHGQERMRIHTNGFVGINATAPTERLEVGGNLRLTGAGSGLIFADGTKQTSAAGGVGTPNNWTATQVFSAGLSANNAQITNVGNPFNAGDATNKAYVDANFVRFVPGAEQLSVGDANGTATMINLRGGSTCCSGPGGHTPAFFKVYQNGSFVATGNLGIGTSPMEGKGYRTSWHTYKGAFRSGYADNEWDDANVGFFSWAGGSNSTASGLYALAFGDTNSAESTSSIVFGSGNQVKGAAGFSAGAGNRVCDTYGVALGNNAKSGGPYINGKCDPETFNIRGLAAVAIGYNVTADQDHTTAMGKFASNNGFQGTFIWSDGAPQAAADTFRNTANNEFAVRATGGVRFRTNLGGTTGCNLPAGSGVFNCTSSRATKENFMLVKGEDVLSSLRNIPVSTWNYISEGRQVRHMGPMAEDFYKTFGLGTNNTSIGVQDLAGVSLAAVKALDERTAQLQQKIAEVEQLRATLKTLEERLAALEQRVRTGDNGQQATESH